MLNSRQQILTRLAANKPAPAPLPQLNLSTAGLPTGPALLEQFAEVAVSIGSSVHRVQQYAEIESILSEKFVAAQQVVSLCPELQVLAKKATEAITQPHALETVDLAILPGQLGVAENSAIWVSEAQMGQRVLPFICQHLALVLPINTLAATMHQAYPLLETETTGYGVFIAGPSKTADIEQSLVLGAHGPRSLIIFIIGYYSNL